MLFAPILSTLTPGMLALSSHARDKGVYPRGRPIDGANDYSWRLAISVWSARSRLGTIVSGLGVVNRCVVKMTKWLKDVHALWDKSPKREAYRVFQQMEGS